MYIDVFQQWAKWPFRAMSYKVAMRSKFETNTRCSIVSDEEQIKMSCF